MDFIFEDDVEEVGAEIEAFCPKCKADSTHVVVSKYEDEIRRVQCNPCGDVHAYRKPRGEAEEETPEPAASKKRQAAKKLGWEEAMVKGEKKPKRSYSPRDTYRENELVNHSIFGMGFVSEVLTENKCEITFKDGRRILVHNRTDVAGPPPPPPLPPPVPKLKGKAAKEAAEAAAAAAELAARGKGAKGKLIALPGKANAKDSKDGKGAKVPPGKASAKEAALPPKKHLKLVKTPVAKPIKPAALKGPKAKPQAKAAAKPAKPAPKPSKPAPKAKPSKPAPARANGKSGAKAPVAKSKAAKRR